LSFEKCENNQFWSGNVWLHWKALQLSTANTMTVVPAAKKVKAPRKTASTESPQPVQTAVQPATVPVEVPAVVAIPVTPTKVIVKEIEMYTPAAASDDWLTQYDADFFAKLALMACNQSDQVCDPVVVVHQPLFTLTDCQLFTECSY
jgi:hypothetical protein